MKTYSKILEITDTEGVKLADNFKQLLHTHLTIGQTRHVCRHGTLSDGHEKITPAQRYYSSIREAYSLSRNIKSKRAQAKMYYADFLDAKDSLSSAKTESEILRAEARFETATNQLEDCLIGVEDQLRQLDEYNKIRLELKDHVESKYPNGIEQAELDNWKAVFEYRMQKGGGMGLGERVDNIPLDAYTKAELGTRYNRPDAIAPLAVVERQAIGALAGGDIKRFITMIKKAELTREAKDESGRHEIPHSKNG